jgi:hypothetical protein
LKDIKFYYAPEASRNIISDNDVKEFYFINRDNISNKYVLTHKETREKLEFIGNTEGLFELKVYLKRGVESNNINVNYSISTVNDMVQLHKQMNYIDISQLKNLYDNGKLKCNNFNQLYNEFKSKHSSTCMGCKKGKMHDISHPLSDSPKPTRCGQLLHIDLFYIGASVWGKKQLIMLLAVDVYSLHVTVVFLKNKTKEELKRALEQVYAIYSIAGNKIEEIRSDMEPGIKALVTEFGMKGIKITFLPLRATMLI